MRTTSLGLTGFLTSTAARRAPASLHDQLKRPIDLFVSLVGLTIAGPLVLLLGGIVKLTSKGPMFYVQERLGLRGKPFRMYKLRTMYADAEAAGPRWCGENDPRITPVGRILRKLHLDELPQLVNVLRGEMTLVGPRPERPCFVDRLKRSIPLYERRLAVKPGITGLAQIKHHADHSIEDVQTKLGYDLEYMKRACLWLDIQILALTAVKVVARQGGSA
ncbi:MAG: sugar transferase [Planctomycetota bacterium]